MDERMPVALPLGATIAAVLTSGRGDAVRAMGPSGMRVAALI